MVVTAGEAVGRDRPNRRRALPPAVLLFAGAAVLPSPSTEVAPLSPQQGLRAIAGATAGLLPQSMIDYSALPPAMPLPPTAGLALSLPSPFGWALDPVAGLGAQVDDNPATDALLAADTKIAAARLRGAAPAKLEIECGWVTRTLQMGGEYWNGLPYGAMPTSLAPPIRLGASLADPIQGPSGDRSNLPPPGPAGAWCRPPPVPIAETSPLANRTFWIPATILAFGIGVFWLSRGLEMPP
jgi:hypothetical protein